MPKNPLNITSQNTKDLFESNLFQRWSFFAPPPTFNERVYFAYKSTEYKKIDFYEILVPVLEKKSKAIPFNTYEQIQDYILASTLSNIETNMRTYQDVLNYTNNQAVVKVSDSLISNKIVEEIEKTNDFKTLINYAKLIAEKNNIDINKYSLQIQIHKISIPQFIDRYSKTRKEEVIFSSNFHNLKYEKI